MRLKNPFTRSIDKNAPARPLTARTQIGGGYGSGYGSGGMNTDGTDDNIPILPSAVPMPRLKDPEKPRIDITPGDLLDAPPPPSIADKKLYDFVVTESFRQARDARIRWERDWRLCIEFGINDNQWIGWDAKTRRWIDFASKDPDPRRFSTTNLIAPRIESVGSMVTQSEIVSIVRGYTDSDLDRQAAMEGKAIVSHYNIQFDNRVQVRKWVDWSLYHTTCFLKTTFNPSAMADVPKYKTGPDGTKTLVGQTSAAVGDIEEVLVPGSKIYLDPCTTEIARCRWLIHTELYPLSWFAERFENGKDVRADRAPGTKGGVATVDIAGGSVWGIQASYGITGMAGGGPAAEPTVNRDVATCYEMWILPGKTTTFPYGAVIYCAGGVVLKPRKRPDGSTAIESAWERAFKVAPNAPDERKTLAKKRIPGNYYPWPYECTTEFPFIDLSYEDNPDSPYGRNLVQRLIEPQMDYNRTMGRIRERLEKDKVIWMSPMLGITGSEKWEDYGNYVKVSYDPNKGGPGSIVQSPAQNPQQFEILAIIQKNMDDIAGIHDPNFRGDTPEGVKSGVAINALKQGDSSRLSKYAARIETAIRRRDTWRMRHAAQFFGEERLIGMDETGNVSARPHAAPAAPSMPSLTAMSAMAAMPQTTGSTGSSGPVGPLTPQVAGMPSSGGLPAPLPAPPAGPQGPPLLQQQQQQPAQPPTPPNPTGNPYANVMAFKALNSGGQVRVIVEAGSALAETADARNARTLEYYQEQVFGPVGSAVAMKTFGQLIESNDSDIILQRADDLMAKEQAELAASMPQPPAPPPPPPDPFAMAAHMSQLKIQENAAQTDAETQQKLALLRAERELDREFGPKMTVAGKASPAGESAAEEKIFGDAALHTAAGHVAGAAALHPNLGEAYGMAKPAPPPVAPGAGKPGATASPSTRSANPQKTAETP